MNPTNFLIEIRVNLIEKYQNDFELHSEIEKYLQRCGFDRQTNEILNLKVGDVVRFIGGLNDDIVFTSKITGFDNDDKVLVLWDCYWFSIDPTEEIRKFCKIHEVTS